ncbi:MAG TPA: hypothetical protein VKV17_21155 [Bryobacteraceae bacterium]|nr:hypothetical protein [Bryobacteraceae bacterium]
MKFACALFVPVLFAHTLPAGSGLDAARNEPNLEKRSGLALENAAAALKEFRAAYDSGDLHTCQAKALEIETSVELAYASLQMTGKDPRRSPKWFKHAEIQSDELVRGIEAMQHDMSFEDRSLLEKTHDRVEQIHDDLLAGLMGGKKK